MLSCQIPTEKSNIFVCKKLKERTSFNNFTTIIQQCEQCHKQGEEKYLENQERSFYVNFVLSDKQIFVDQNYEEIYNKALGYFKNNKNNTHFISQLKQRVLFFVINPKIDFDNNFKNKLIDVINNIKKFNLIEDIDNFVSDESIFLPFYFQTLSSFLIKYKENKKLVISFFQNQLTMCLVKKQYLMKIVEEKKDILDDEFFENFGIFLNQYDENLKKIIQDPNFKITPPIQKVSIIDKIKGIKGAFSRIKDKTIKEGVKTIWAKEEEIIERQICCTTCTDGSSCPYCGCQIKKSWFLPLGKSELTTEGCPNPITYPHLKKFPHKNYWKVCLEKTSILIPSRNEKYLVNTIKNLLETSTGDIEILVGIDGKTNFDYFVDDYRVVYIKYDNPVGKRYILNELAAISNGKYLFRIDAHCIMNYGWDTKLKCLCDNDTIISSSISEINEEKWELNEITYNSLYFDKNLEIYWGANQVDKINNIMCFYPSGWMITKDTFNKFNGYNENLGQYVNEEIEWSLNILLYGGKILNRSDVICSHLFRDEFPYLMNDDIFKSKEILNKIWKDDSVFKKIRIEDIFPIFSNTSFEKT